jgi:hypothetical protein
MVRRKSQRVRIVDVVPYIVRADGSKVMVNRETNAFEETNPEGFTAWMKERDDIAKGLG